MAAFTGKALASNYAYLNETRELLGSHLVLYPISVEDVQHVVTKANKLAIKIRSGSQTTAEDEQQVPDGIVLDLSDLNHAELKGDLLIADAGVKNHRLAEILGDRIIPLSDNALRSVASDLLKPSSGPLTRGLGPLSDYVVSVHVVDRDAKAFELCAENHPNWLEQVKAERLIVTRVVFKTVPAESLWMLRLSLPHPAQDVHEKLTAEMFANYSANMKAYLSMRSHRGPMPDIALLTFALVGQTEDEKQAAKTRIATTLAALKELMPLPELQIVSGDMLMGELVIEFSGADIYSALLDIGQAAANDPGVITRRQVKHKPITAKTGSLVNTYVVSSAGVSNTPEQSVDLDVRIEIGDDNALKLSTYEFELAEKIPYLAAQAHAEEPDNYVLYAPTEAAVDAELAELLERFELSAAGAEIADFKGTVYSPDEPRYRKKILQYANQFKVTEHTTPWLMCEPADEADIAVALQYAAAQGKAVVVRSGGHQYSGLSSGGSETLVLLMDRFNGLQIDADTGMVWAGAAAKLSSFSAQLKLNRLTLPYGECPEVAVGGHVQTGGYGHIGRSIGPLVDRVQSFRIVLASGEAKRVRRPANGSSFEDNELFRAVLGGNPGSFGVITEYEFRAIKPEEYTASANYGISREFSLPLAKALLGQLQHWARRVEDGSLPLGWDFTITFLSAGGRIPGSLINSKLSYVHDDSMPNETDEQASRGVQEYLALMRDTPPQSVKDFLLWFKHRDIHAATATPLADMSDSFVRRWPQTSWRGREYDLPYQKRLNSSYKAMSTPFIDKLAESLDSVIGQGYFSELKAVTQIWIGGGRFLNEQGMSEAALPHRRAVNTFTFDIFHQGSAESECKAKELQQHMQQIVDEHFSEQEYRMFWATFGDAGSDDLNMSKPETQRKYYDTQAEFERLQAVKRAVDPGNVLRSSFTIPLD